MMRRKLLLTVAVFAIAALAAYNTAHGLQPTFRQQILPMDCVFETINDGLGTIHYLTPTECGQVIPTPPPGGDGNSTSVAPATKTQTKTTSRTSALSPFVPITSVDNGAGHADDSVTNTGTSLLLNNIAGTLNDKGYVVNIRVGNILFYRPSDNPLAPIRRIVITQVQASHLEFHVQPLAISPVLPLNRTTYFDKLGDGEPAVSIRLLGVTDKKIATINIRLLRQKQPSVRPVGVSVQLIVLGVLISLSLALRLKSNWFVGKK